MEVLIDSCHERVAMESQMVSAFQSFMQQKTKKEILAGLYTFPIIPVICLS